MVLFYFDVYMYIHVYTVKVRDSNTAHTHPTCTFTKAFSPIKFYMCTHVSVQAWCNWWRDGG